MAAQRYLVDTHVFLWALSGSKRLRKTVSTVIADPDSLVFVSVASLWEISIKTTIGKLKIPGDFFEVVSESAYEVLPILLPHLDRYRALPLLHRDPFDRLLVAQAQEESLTLVTNDQAIAAYDGLTVLRGD